MNTKTEHPMLKIQLGEDGNPKVYAQGTPRSTRRAPQPSRLHFAPQPLLRSA